MKFLDVHKQNQPIRKKINNAIQEVMDSGVFIGGSHVTKLEEKIAKLHGVSCAVGVNSGTDALLLALWALGIGDGDEVITTPFTFIATAETIALTGAKPVFVDIDPTTFNIDPAHIEKHITKKTRAILPVHLFGQVADMAMIMKIARKHKLRVIEDAAQAIGAQQNRRKVTSIGDVGCISFFPSKNLGACGDGGMVLTHSKKIAETVRMVRNHGSSPQEKYKNLTLGTNSRLDAIQAAIVDVKSNQSNAWNKERIAIAKRYSTLLREIKEVTTPRTVGGLGSHVFNQYTIRVQKRDALKKYLLTLNIPTMIYYPLPLHRQPAFGYLGYTKNNFPEAEKASQEVLSLPMYPGLTRKDQNLVVKGIRQFFKT